MALKYSRSGEILPRRENERFKGKCLTTLKLKDCTIVRTPADMSRKGSNSSTLTLNSTSEKRGGSGEGRGGAGYLISLSPQGRSGIYLCLTFPVCDVI